MYCSHHVFQNIWSDLSDLKNSHKLVGPDLEDIYKQIVQQIVLNKGNTLELPLRKHLFCQSNHLAK